MVFNLKIHGISSLWGCRQHKGTINPRNDTVGKIMPMKAGIAGLILWVMLYGKCANLEQRVIVFRSLCFHKSVAAVVAKVSWKVLTCR